MSTQLSSNIWRLFSNSNWSWRLTEVIFHFATKQASWCACKLAEICYFCQLRYKSLTVTSNKTCSLEMHGLMNSTVYSWIPLKRSLVQLLLCTTVESYYEILCSLQNSIMCDFQNKTSGCITDRRATWNLFIGEVKQNVICINDVCSFIFVNCNVFVANCTRVANFLHNNSYIQMHIVKK